MPACKFITSHGAVLALIAQNGHLTIREMAHRLGLTERMIHNSIAVLVAHGYLSKHRVGRLNRYHLRPDVPLGQPGLDAVSLGDSLRGMQVDAREQANGLAQPSRNAGRQSEQPPPPGLPDATAKTSSQLSQEVKKLWSTAYNIREKARNVCEQSRVMRAERAKKQKPLASPPLL